VEFEGWGWGNENFFFLDPDSLQNEKIEIGVNKEGDFFIYSWGQGWDQGRTYLSSYQVREYVWKKRKHINSQLKRLGG